MKITSSSGYEIKKSESKNRFFEDTIRIREFTTSILRESFAPL
jgi:hypothetical protein